MKQNHVQTPLTPEELEEERLKQMMGEITIGQESVKESQHSTRRKVRDLVSGGEDYEAKLAWMKKTSESIPLSEGFFDTTDSGFFTPPSEFKFRSGFDTNPGIGPIDWAAYLSKPKQ